MISIRAGPLQGFQQGRTFSRSVLGTWQWRDGLHVSETRPVALLQSVCVGTVLTLLGEPEEQRDVGLSEIAREVVAPAVVDGAIASAD